ncbi:hypothetical protein LIA77_10444 [Sarocladium implicatum]|nr:hypothetical protein LIA77_10444 [Sarocladium implicatum]
MSGTSSVGQASVYEAGDQRNYKNSELDNKDHYHEGKENSHKSLDSKDERSIANKLAAEEKYKEEGSDISKEAQLAQQDPTAPAKMHGNEPSKGAKIDAELQAEEEEELKRKGKA